MTDRVGTGTRLGAYEIVASIGAGGMGEVFRARDTTLHRDVAIKVLPAAMAAEPERLARFKREAQVLASLNHPGIAHVHGFEAATLPDGSTAHFLAMEMVEGEDLAERLKRGAIPAEESIAIAKQIAEGLEEAHEHGIIHRDLKPANVKVTPDGKVKILDFGLAKALEGDSATSAANSQVSHSPTMSRHMTEAGMIMGTAAYMSPEQARGKVVDRRADIWSFGAVLFEMVSGTRLFAGETVSDTLAAVLREEIPWTRLPADAPRGLIQLMKRCLVRDPRHRLRDIGEARLALSSTEDMEPGAGPPAAPTSASTRLVGVWPAIAAACLVTGFVVGGFGVGRLRDNPTPAMDRPARSLIVASEGRELLDSQAISPDGRFVAFTASDKLWIRKLSELEAREVKDSKGAQQPFWSPRSDAIAFATDKALFKVSLDGEKPVELCKLSRGAFTGGSWSAIKGIAFTVSRGNLDGDVLRIPEAGGEPEIFTRADRTKGEYRLHQPHFLPDGRTLLYTVVTAGATGGIAVDREGTRTPLGLGGAEGSAYSPNGHVLFTRRNEDSSSNLWAVSFSLDTLAPRGEPFLVARSGTGVTASEGGTVVYKHVRPDPDQLIWVDRGGRILGTIGEAADVRLNVPAISPDGSMVAANRRVTGIIAVWDVDRGIMTPITGESERGFAGGWLPGSRELAYSPRGAEEVVRVRRADGTGEPRVLLDRKTFAMSFSKDGAYAVFYTLDPKMGRDLWALPLENLKKKGEPFLLIGTSANEVNPQISPDGKWLAYQSDATNQWEVYVQSFPRGEGRLQVSNGGGQHPRWNPRGGELFYVSGGDDLVAVDLTTAPDLRVGIPRLLWSGKTVGTRLTSDAIERTYDVAPDGKRFVVVRGNDTGKSDVVLSEGWLPSEAPKSRD
jgi:eukaryotic-like serine/threonine-protein kinase